MLYLDTTSKLANLKDLPPEVPVYCDLKEPISIDDILNLDISNMMKMRILSRINVLITYYDFISWILSMINECNTGINKISAVAESTLNRIIELQFDDAEKEYMIDRYQTFLDALLDIYSHSKSLVNFSRAFTHGDRVEMLDTLFYIISQINELITPADNSFTDHMMEYGINLIKGDSDKEKSLAKKGE